MEAKEYQELAKAAWKLNSDSAKGIAESAFARNRVSVPSVAAIPQFSALLADLQKTSFIHGFVAALYAIEQAAEVQNAR